MAAEKMATAYLRNEKIYLHPDSETVKGFWMACEPVLVTNEKDEGLGETVLQILAQSTENIPHPESWAHAESLNAIKALVRATGVHSYEAFADSTKCVGIRLDNTGVIFTPTLNGGYRRRFLNLKADIRCEPLAQEVGSALIHAFEACET